MSWTRAAQFGWQAIKEGEAIKGAYDEVKDIYNTVKSEFSSGHSKNKKRARESALSTDYKSKKRNINHSPIQPQVPTSKKATVIPPSPKATSTTMSSSTHPNDEVPVMPVPRAVSKSHPEYFTIKLPMFYEWHLDLTSATDINNMQWRLNSVYDPVVSGTSPAARQPLGRDSWSTIYDYYRVVSADFNMTFDYIHGWLGNDATGAVAEALNTPNVLVGYQITADGAEKATTAAGFVEQKHSKAVMLRPRQMEITNTFSATSVDPSGVSRQAYTGGSTSMSFHYDPTQWDYHVQETGVEERWTPKDSNPATTHFILPTIAYPKHAGLSAQESIRVGLTVFATYTCQWREVNSTLKRTIDEAL